MLQVYPTGQPPIPIAALPGFHLSTVHGQVATPLPPAGVSLSFSVPPGGAGATLRLQSVALSPQAQNGLYAASDAHDVTLR